MGEKIVVGPINQGIRTDRTPFVIDNDSFPVLQNAYQWRGRIKRKRGTSFLGRLQRYFNSTSTSYSSTATINLTAGAANLLTGFSLESGGNIIPGSVTINDITAGITYTDPAEDGTLLGGSGGTINYASGAITISGGGGNSINATFLYNPSLPVLGLEDLNITPSQQFPGNLAFDSVYSYNISTAFPYSIYDVSFYKNPSNGTYAGYTAKTNWTPTKWNGQNYQQFWSTNYQSAFWVTNGINVPFNAADIGMQFKPIVTTTIVAGGPPAQVTLQITGHGLVVGDFVFVNEVLTTTGINFQTGFVITVTDANNVIVQFPNATIANNGTGGIAQYLTRMADPSKDCLRWYDGDPTNGNATTPILNQPKGWVNFMPPLSQSSFSIEDLPPAQYYLVGARVIVPFKDRILFFGPVVQSSTSAAIYLQDTVVYSQNGTPFYTASFTGSVTSPTTIRPILTPDNQTAVPSTFFADSTGFGGFITAGFAQPILTVSPNEDVLIVGFSNRQTRFVYTGNDIVPFNFFVINSELGSGSTFSTITLDRGVLTVGEHGIIETSQIGSKRIDLQIPDNVFQFKYQNNGAERITAQRDFINEWVYFSYPANNSTCNFPTQTLQYNYRDDSWAIFTECFTTYGTFRETSGYTWANIGQFFPTWAEWNEPWNAGSSTILQPKVIAGTTQGFILFRDDGTGESNCVKIDNFSASLVTSINHCLREGDFIIISGCIGTIGTQVNDKIFKVGTVPSSDTFLLDPPISAGTYFGGGLILKMYVPIIQTKQFPVSWAMGRKTRIGPQQYLFTKTANAQIQLLIYLSQNAVSAWNKGPIVPDAESENNGLIYSSVLYTCPESINLGLTPANTNLVNLTNISGSGNAMTNDQSQIWHRLNTSLIGDTVQIGFTLSEDQMRDENLNNQFAEIELHGFILDVTPSQVLA